MVKKKNDLLSTRVEDIDFGDLGHDEHIARDYWWLLLIRGLALIGLGMMAIIWPGVTLLVLATIFAVYLIAVGVVDVIVGARTVKVSKLWFLRIILGIAEITVGVYLVNNATLTLAAFILLIGLFLVFQGLVEIISAFRTPSDFGHKFWTIFAGFIGVAVGLIVLRQPITGGLAFTWLLGFYGLLAGALSISVALSLRSGGKHNKAVRA